MITIGGMRDWGIHNGGMREGHIQWGHEGLGNLLGKYERHSKNGKVHKSVPNGTFEVFE